MTEHDDRDLGERFRALRREDASAAPAFQATLARARGAGKPRRRALGLAVALVVASVVVALLARRRPPTDLANVRLKTPTDFLLTLPNADLLRTVPEIGRVTITLDRRTP